MTWFAAHVVMVVKFKRGPQKRFPVWENIVLVKADTEQQAFAKAEALGNDEANDNDGSFRWDGKPARWEFAGVRKIVECAVISQRPGDGDELTFNELEFDSLTAVEAFARAMPATARYNERFRILDEPAGETEGKRKRKRA